MNRHLIYIIGIVLLAACSHIAEDERLVYVKPPEVARAVLIEDFTGQRCVNCPTAHDEIARLRREYGDSTIVAVSIHGGPLAVASTQKVLGLRTAEGDEYVRYWQTENSLPKGLVNRMAPVSNPDQWAAQVRQAIARPAPLMLHIANDYLASTRQLTVSVTLQAVEPVRGRLQLWLTESGITAMQLMPDGTANPEYRHDHVFRCSINGTWGTEITAEAGQTLTTSHAITLDDGWPPDKMSVVAFVYDDNGVQQVTAAALTN